MSVGAACAVLAILIEVGLDQVVAVAPWLIVPFAFGILAAVLGGWLGGGLAAVVALAAQAVVIPARVPGVERVEGLGLAIEVGASVAALLIGLWMRSLLLQPRARSPVPAPAGGWVNGIDETTGLPYRRGPSVAPRAARASVEEARSAATVSPGAVAWSASEPPVEAGGRASSGRLAGRLRNRWPGDARPLARDDRDPASVAAAVREIGGARTAAQIADALARHAVALSRAGGAIAYLAQDGADGLVALGRHGDGVAGAPERIPAGSGSAAAGQPGPAGGRRAGAAQAPTTAPAPAAGAGLAPGTDRRGPVDLRIARGATSHGILRLVPGPDVALDPGPLVEIVVQVAADALERARLQTARRAADAEAAGAVGRVAILAHLAAALVGGRTIDDVARTLVDLAVDDLTAGFAVIHVPDPATGAFRLVHARGYPAGLVAGEQSVAPSAQTPVNRAVHDLAIVEVSGEDGWRTAFPTLSNVPAITGARVIMAIPMHVGGVVHAVLTIGWRSAADRARVDRDVLATAADQGAQALERALLHAQDEDARKFQEAFIGVVSHELRTPITTILAGSRLLRRRLGGDPRATELSDDIEVEADRLARIVDDLLVLSRLERRHLTIADEPVHLDHLLTRIIRSESARWPDHRIEVPPSASRHVVIGDETYVEQVLRNLVSNAAKYSPLGSLVEVAVNDAPDGDVHVRVLDRGPGVAPAEVEDLFSLFYRSPTTAASAAGAGIGLFVSRRLVTEMGGRMWAQPRPDGGSEFGFSMSTYPLDDSELDGVTVGRLDPTGS